MAPVCGRFSVFSPEEILVANFVATEVTAIPTPRYNIAPEQDIVVIIRSDACRLVDMRWGLIPFSTKQPASDLSTINA